MTATQKAMNCPNGVTTSGTIPKAGRTAACDPILLGQKIWLEGYGYRTCEDTGGDIKGDHIDVFFNTYDEALQTNVRDVHFAVI